MWHPVCVVGIHKRNPPPSGGIYGFTCAHCKRFIHRPVSERVADAALAAEARGDMDEALRIATERRV